MSFNTVKTPFRILLTGVNITTGAASASAAIPVNSAAIAARYVVVSCTVNARIRVGQSGVTALATDMLIGPSSGPVILDVSGCTHIAAIQDTGAGVVSVCPMEW